MKRLLTAREVAESLGLVPETILAYAREGKLPSFQLPSGQIRIRESELEAWLEDRRRSSQAERSKVGLASIHSEEESHA